MQGKVRGLDGLVAKQSAVNETGELRTPQIAGVAVSPDPPGGACRRTCQRDRARLLGHLEKPIVQVHMTTTLPGRVRAWGLHQLGRTGYSW